MVPKTWAVLSDAMDEGCGHAARRAVEIIQDFGAIGLTDTGRADERQNAIEEAIRQEVLNAICERFDFVDPEGE